MKFPESWLRTIVNPLLSSSELANSLTMAGLEVETVEPVAPTFNRVVVAEVLSINKHVNADRLNICQVKIDKAANNEPLQIICGATNIHVGAKVPCALIGAQLPCMSIKQVSVRGVESFGMLCSAKELGIREETEGLLLLPSDAPTGADFREYYELDDKIFTLKLTPNRADCLGLSGVAREVAAISSSQLNLAEIKSVKCEIANTLTIQVDEPDACPLYCGRIIRKIRLDAPTPTWISRRLVRSGIHTVNTVVDITNYVMLETGQPMHAFNLAKIAGQFSGTIHVRFANLREKLQLLNGEDIALRSDMLLIADEINPLALAGIMGGNESKVEHGTIDLFLESAFFSPEVIAGKALRLGINSDSAHRFERGVDFAITHKALERATSLIQSICGGLAGPITEVKGKLPQRKPILLREKRVQRILGVDLDKSKITDLLQRLQFDFYIKKELFHVVPPTYRFDLVIEEDLIEEIARIYGYNNIPANLPHGSLKILPESETIRTPMQLRRILVARDYQEVINYAFVDTEWEESLVNNSTPVMLKNPISNQMNAMRSSLIGGLISNLQFNLNRKQNRVRLFEIGSCFEKTSKTYTQSDKLAGLCYGNIVTEQWGLPERNVDFYDAKADIEVLFWPKTIKFEVTPHPALHPSKSAQIRLNDNIVGWLGELHPRWQQKANLTKSVMLFEIDLGVLMRRAIPMAAKIPKFPSVRRDIAVIVADSVNAQSLLDSMYALNSPIISEIALFDVYRGKEMAHGKKSLAFRVLLQDTKKTLTESDIDLVISKLVKILKNKFEARLRN